VSSHQRRPTSAGNKRTQAAPPPAAAAPSWQRGGHLAGALVILVGLGGIWHATQAAATTPPAPRAAPASATAPAVAGRAGIVVRDAYVRPNGSADAVAFFTVNNRGGAPDFLTAVSSDEIAHDVALYLSSDEVSTGAITIGPGSTEKLAPGGQHVRLEPYRRLLPGQSIPLTLRFSRAGDITVRATVR
jgi:copper(I)-binding protein